MINHNNLADCEAISLSYGKIEKKITYIFFPYLDKGVTRVGYPKAYILYLVHFHGDRDYFECHEILEEYWKHVAPKDRNSHWVGLIQIAVALYHERRKNKPGAGRTITKAINNLNNNRYELTQLGLDIDKLFILLNEIKERINTCQPYESINLPLLDPQLISQCVAECEQLGLSWQHNCALADPNIINKHLLRDRSKIIEERARQLQIHGLKK